MVDRKKSPEALEPFGSPILFAEPSWYQGFPSPYYTKDHAEYRNKVRAFCDEHLATFVDEWIDKGEHYPIELHQKAYEAGISGILYPVEYGGYRPPNHDAFYEVILWAELARVGGGVLGQLAINSMALPPIVNFGSEQLKEKVLRDVITGNKSISLMISEPTAGSDVARIQGTAERKGDHYIINANKKWITGSLIADGWCALLRTGGDGARGLSCIYIPAGLPGITIRKMDTMFDK